ncbi:hypothetical protein L1N85_24650 [Paenibacillus alkaliterrae]|uniref:hypothetical protein n=1 Tax=Paenibacillus alkaliterrae TaxID=320909 RepID=UPI001F29A7DD|nr:hypothetical protein [Paenibacillus alkaliterrae]MCF2941532.1 hypothetical protein [Paenibacillus alkaliterrae]
MAQEIEITLRLRVSDEQLQAAGMTAAQFAQNMILFEHGFDIPSVVLSQGERGTDPVERWDAAIVMSKVITESNEGDIDLALKRIVEQESHMNSEISVYQKNDDTSFIAWAIAD